MRYNRRAWLTLTLAFLWLLPLREGRTQELPEKQRKALGKHATRVEAKAKTLGLVLDYDEPPKPIKITRPEYPMEAFRKGRDGKVLLMLVIDASGHVAEAEALEATYGFREAAVACVRQWEFRAATKGGQAVGTVVTAPVAFNISQ